VPSLDEAARLDPLLRDVPRALRDEVIRALDAVADDADSHVEKLRKAADDQLARALEDRGDALKLLAADALITYVCQVTSEENPNALATLL